LNSYIENELKQIKIFLKNDPTVGSNREPKTQARAIALRQQATSGSGLKRPYKARVHSFGA